VIVVEGCMDFGVCLAESLSDGLGWFSLLIYSWHMCISLSITLARFVCFGTCL
jgi:hypothetical protein